MTKGLFDPGIYDVLVPTKYITTIAKIHKPRKPITHRATLRIPFQAARKLLSSLIVPFIGSRKFTKSQKFSYVGNRADQDKVTSLILKARRDEVEMSFARWPTREACVTEQRSLGHDEKDAEQICNIIGDRAEKGILYKATPDTPVQVISKMSGDNDEMVVVGWGTYELKDPQNDVITTQGQVRALQKWFNQVPEDYRHIHYSHSNFIGGKPLLKWQGPDGKLYHSHVNEKGTIIIAKVRPDDGLRLTKELRDKIRKGEISMFSISADPLNFEVKMEKGEMVKYHYDLDPIEYTFCEKGVNPKAHFEHVFEGTRMLKQKPLHPTDKDRLVNHYGEEKALKLIELIGLDEAVKLLPPRQQQQQKISKKVEKRGSQWCVIHCTGPDAGKPIKCFSTKSEADAMHRAIQANKSIVKDERPPKALTNEELFQQLLRKHEVDFNES